MKKVLLIICLTFGMAQADSWNHQNKKAGYNTQRTTVVTKTIYVKQNRQHMNRTQEVNRVRYVTQNHQNNRAVGAVLGGVVGGIIGNQIGGGSGNTVATVGGAIIGTVVGSNLAKNHTTQRVVYYKTRPTHQYKRVASVSHDRFHRRTHR
ncbi:glycine zipper 2TM domain-containing protein [Sulfurospirillum sp. 1612]|uniref:glycine zipper 2TM domain-containing protein n=1 Tax=Sulfurospirillum sp. 1612 TaxID=3094835 RepID=UPI002F9418BF